jgi:hypothetical protein
MLIGFGQITCWHCRSADKEKTMSKSDKKFVTVAAVGIGSIVLMGWLQSSPNCDRGCQTQLEHLKDHVLAGLFKVALAQLGL